jgi:hypothetical protein
MLATAAADGVTDDIGWGGGAAAIADRRGAGEGPTFEAPATISASPRRDDDTTGRGAGDTDGATTAGDSETDGGGVTSRSRRRSEPLPWAPLPATRKPPPAAGEATAAWAPPATLERGVEPA